MGGHITAEDIVFHELLRRSGEHTAIRHAIEGLRGAQRLRSIVGTVLAIAADLETELAEIARDGGYPVGDPQYPHKVVAGGPPCPSCGFRIPLKVYTRLTDQELNDLVRSSPLQRQGADLSDAEIEAFHVAWQGAASVGPIRMPTEGAPIPLGGLALVHPSEGPTPPTTGRSCSHRECPHLARCIGAGDCIEPAMLMPRTVVAFDRGAGADYTATYIGPAVASGTNPPNDLPGYLPLRKADGDA